MKGFDFMVKKVLFTAICFLFIFSSSAFAENIEVILDGKTMQFSVEPQIIKGSTMVPLRSIFEAIGADVIWEQSTQKITAKKESTTISLTIGNKTAYKNNEAITLSEPGTIIKGSTLVPLRFVAESFGAYVHWNGSEGVISISSDGSQVTYQSNYVKINTATIEQLKRIIHIDDERAKEIIKLRKSKPFASFDDLKRITGIGTARVTDIKAEGIIKF